MANTTSLSIELMETGSSSKEVIFNDAVNGLMNGLCGYISKSVAGSADVTLTATEARNMILEYTGAITANINIIVPTEERLYVIFNNTSGAFTVTTKPVAGTGVAVTQGTKALLYCNGTNVITGVSGSGGGGVTDGDKGDITVTGSGATWTIDNDVVTYAKMQNVSATNRLLGRSTAGAGDTEEITVGGDISQSGSTFTIANDAVTYAKMQNVSATSRVLARKTAGAGDTEEATLSEVLDFIGSAAQGDILYRGAAAWARLGAGTSGEFLQTQGAGANPQWAGGSVSGGAANKLAIWSGASALTNDTDLHYDSTNNRLGIGTATFGTSFSNGLALLVSPTNPSTDVTDVVQLHARDLAAGNTGLSIRTENGEISLFGGRLALNSTSFQSGGVVAGGVQYEGNGKLLELNNAVHIAHGMTSLINTTGYFDIQPIILGTGGTMIRSFGESTEALHIQAIVSANPATTKTAASTAAMTMHTGLKSGTTAAGLGAGVNMFSISDYPSASNKWILDTDGDTWQPGAATFKLAIEANTDGSGTPNALDASTETFKVFTNEGTTVLNYEALPAAAAGLCFFFIVQDADGMRVVATTGDTIRFGASVSSAGGSIESTTIGNTLFLIAINATEWIAMCPVGAWTTA